jgi:hypothetical protein
MTNTAQSQPQSVRQDGHRLGTTWRAANGDAALGGLAILEMLCHLLLNHLPTNMCEHYEPRPSEEPVHWVGGICIRNSTSTRAHPTTNK